jgi:hypothetical protein
MEEDIFASISKFDDFVSEIRGVTKAIQYERQQGIHTYHLCEKCNQNGCRNTCEQCLSKQLIELCLSYFSK